MPNLPAAAKHMRQSEKRRQANKARKTELKSLSKQIERALHDGKQEEAKTLVSRLAKRTDQAASRKVLHPNTAARRKSRMDRLLFKASQKAPAAT